MIDDIFVRLQLVQEILINSFSNADYSERKLILFREMPSRSCPHDVCQLEWLSKWLTVREKVNSDVSIFIHNSLSSRDGWQTQREKWSEFPARWWPLTFNWLPILGQCTAITRHHSPRTSAFLAPAAGFDTGDGCESAVSASDGESVGSPCFFGCNRGNLKIHSIHKFCVLTRTSFLGAARGKNLRADK